jgi:LacI family transcriptional regulator
MPRHSESPSSRELARQAGVSQSTVSRYLNNDPRVSKRARRAIETAMNTLGYTPNAAARTLITGRSQLIGLVVSNITNPFYPEVIEAVVATAAERGYNVILCNTQENPKLQLSSLELLVAHQVDGAILTSMMLGADQDAVARLLKRTPMVQVNRTAADLYTDTVQLDNIRGGELAARHLLDLGHTRIGYIGGNPGTSTNQNRFGGFSRALEDHKVPADPALVRHGQFTHASGYELTREILDGPTPPTALVCGDDEVAMGAIDAVIDHGLRVPEDVAVVGFDDVPVASLRPIGLTTVRQPAAEMGRRAVELLIDRIGADEPREPVDVLLRPKLVVRRTSGRTPEQCLTPVDRPGSGVPSQ